MPNAPAADPTRRFHVVMASAIGADKTTKGVEAGLRPRHFMLELAKRLDATLYEPAPAEAKPALLHRLIKTPAPLIALAARVADAATDADVIFCNSEAVAIPVAHALLRAGKRTRLASFGHNLYRPRIAASKLVSGAYRRINRFYVISSDQLRDPSTQRLYLEQVDDQFFTPDDGSMAKSYRTDRPLIVSVGLEQRDYTTLAAATGSMNVDVRISGASTDARVLQGTFPDVRPANMSQQFYEWPDLRDLYRSADLVVVPVRPNQYAAGITSILEALAVGKPVIASQTSGLAGTLADDAAIRWVPPSDPDKRRAEIEILLGDPQARQTLAARGAEIFRAHHRKNLRTAFMENELRAL
jgi:Glycosyl transferases group 1